MEQLPRVKIQGAGLIGTSCALALKSRCYDVSIFDENGSAQALARDLIDQPNDSSLTEFEVVIVAVPVSQTFTVIKSEYSMNPRSILMDVGSTKRELQLEVDSLSDISSHFIGTHPMAGREVSGAQSARADLFMGRAWIITPSKICSPETVATASKIIEACGAKVYAMTPAEHDELLAQISHLPQILSSILAGELLTLSEESLNLAGQGLRDTTRLADSSADLWLDILDSNRQFIDVQLKSFGSRIDQLRDALINRNRTELVDIFKKGNLGRSQISGKHGAKARSYTNISVVITDKPGQLGALFSECADANVNVEDLSIEHSPGQFTGLITLALSESDAKKLEAHLRAKSWKVHRT